MEKLININSDSAVEITKEIVPLFWFDRLLLLGLILLGLGVFFYILKKGKGILDLTKRR